MRINNSTLIAAPVDLSDDWASAPQYLGHIYGFSIQLVFMGDPEGSFKLQSSNDEGHPTAGAPEQYNGVTNWTDIAGSSQAVDESGDHTWNAENLGCAWVRVVWTASGLTGSLTSARCNLKGV